MCFPKPSTASTRRSPSIGVTPWKTMEAVELATLEWVSWFSHPCLLEPVGYIPPAEA